MNHVESDTINGACGCRVVDKLLILFWIHWVLNILLVERNMEILGVESFPRCTLWIRNFQWLIFFVYILLSMLSGDFLLCQTFWSKYLWIFLAIYVDYSYFDAQVRCTYLVPNMTLTLMFNRNYNNLRYSIKKIKSLLEQKFFLLKSVC